MKENETEKDTTAENPDVNFEPKDVNIRAIMYIAIGFIVAAVVINLLVWWLYDYLRQSDPHHGRLSSSEIKATVPQPPEPRLQVSPSTDLQTLESTQRDQLNQYGWIDQQKGIVKIPVEEAMKQIVQKGLPTPAKPTATQTQAGQQTNQQRAANMTRTSAGQAARRAQ
jgi:hypothetical protein